MRIKGAIFDLDGTLLDSMGVWEKIDIAFLEKRGLAAYPGYVEAIAPLGFRAAAEYTIRCYQLQETLEELMAEWDQMAADAYRNDVFLKPGAEEFLLFLRDQGIRLAVATASYESLFVPALKHNGIFELFESFTTIQEVKRGKGFPDIYLRAAEKLGLMPEECAVFEDILTGITGAKDGGFFTVGVYDTSSDAFWEEIQETADLSVRSFLDARELCLNSL